MAARYFGYMWCFLLLLVIVAVLWVSTRVAPSVERPMPYLRHSVGMTLTIQKSGQLGNQMFQIASLIGIGLSNKVPVVFNHGYDSFRKIFELAKCDYPTISTREEKKYRELHRPLGADVHISTHFKFQPLASSTILQLPSSLFNARSTAVTTGDGDQIQTAIEGSMLDAVQHASTGTLFWPLVQVKSSG
ncbi:hypothetical protein CAPTEDRAFT_190215 [Capitella teleta]|uniref:L-Fucosyltransferase n=1 Tax=Capitella teleta TaxID=283909 RepID=R7T603_CAPTE|nr:hypothetical protein CAPTEDRAFT_190215 [Capitella teleta]|eukprot:ELT88909.1 hypothetical protein CAPTEDRAFT_190215 [Capitella teleta]